jgi:tripartite-type tricarboxylate transporter receptor subunit TctC
MTLNRQFIKALEYPAVKANIAAEGALSGGNSPEEFAAFIRTEFDKYIKLVKAARLTPES